MRQVLSLVDSKPVTLRMGGNHLTQAPKIVLTRAERIALEELATRNAEEHPAAIRARIILAAAQGLTRHDIAKELKVRTKTVARWCNAFSESGIEGLRAQGKALGRKPHIWKREAPRILHYTRNVAPPNGRRWTCRSLAGHLNVSISLVQRVWRAEGITAAMLREFVAPPPFQPGEKAAIIGVFFCGQQRAIALEIPAANAAPSACKSEDLVLFASYGSEEEQATIPSPRLVRMQVDRQIHFLDSVLRRAQPGSIVRVVTDSDQTFAHSRLRRWLSRTERIVLHHYTSARKYLLDAEAECRARMCAGITRSMAACFSASGDPVHCETPSPHFHGPAVAYPSTPVSAFQLHSL